MATVNVGNFVRPAWSSMFTAAEYAVCEAGLQRPEQGISLRRLIRLAGNKALPSIALSENLRKAMIDLVAKRCRSETKESLDIILSRSLSLINTCVWADRIVFYPDRVAFAFLQNEAVELGIIREDLLRNAHWLNNPRQQNKRIVTGAPK